MSHRLEIVLISLFVGAPYEPNRLEAEMVSLDKAETPTISDRNLKGREI